MRVATPTGWERGERETQGDGQEWPVETKERASTREERTQARLKMRMSMRGEKEG